MFDQAAVFVRNAIGVKQETLHTSRIYLVNYQEVALKVLT